MSEVGEVSIGHQDKPLVPEAKSGLVQEAMKEVDGVFLIGREVVYANKDYIEGASLGVGRLKRVATNGSPRENGFRQVNDLQEKEGTAIRSSLQRMDDNLKQTVIPQNVREEIEEKLVKTATESEQKEREEQGEEAINLFSGMLVDITRLTNKLQEQRRRIKSAASENEQEAGVVSRRFVSELTRDYDQASRRLAETVHDLDLRVKNTEVRGDEGSQKRLNRFRRLIAEIG